MPITNLISNPGFEAGALTNWTGSGWSVATDPQAGTYNAQTTALDATPLRLISDTVAVVGMRWYDVSLYAKVSGGGHQTDFYVKWYTETSGGRLIRRDWIDPTGLSSSYSFFTDRLRAPRNALGMAIEIQFSVGGPPRTINVDSFEAVEAVTPLLGDEPSYHVLIHDQVSMVGIKLEDVTHFRRLPRGPGAERKSVVQQTWAGGRGNQRMSTDMSRCYDLGWLWSMVEGQLMSGPLCTYTPSGIRSATQSMPGSVAWQTLRQGGVRAVGAKLTPAANYNADQLVVILRKVGDPGDGTLALRSDSTGSPGTLLQSLTVGKSGDYTFTDWLSKVVEGDYAGTQAVVSGTPYWVTFDSGSETDEDNYWQIAVNSSDVTGALSSDGSSWSVGVAAPYYRVVDAGSAPERVHYFEYKRQLYAATQPKDQTAAGALYMNGDRGVATGAQTTTTLKDTTKAWTVNEFAGGVVLIYASTNKGIARRITSNTSDTLTLGAAWPVVCATGATGSEYLIMGTNKWTALSIGLTAPVTGVTVAKNIAYLAQGDAVTMRRMREYNNAGAWTRNSAADGGNLATLLLTAADSTGKQKVYRARNDTVEVAVSDTKDWGTDLVFENATAVGDRESLITSLVVHDGDVWAGKEDSLWRFRNSIWSQLNLDISAGRDLNNGVKMRGWNTNLYFAFMDGFERLYGQVADDIGPNRDEGMPANRRGRATDFRPVLQYGYIAWDGGDDNYSAILATPAPGGAWHELYRAPTAGKRITSVFYQTIPLLGNRLWFNEGPDFAFLSMPDDTHTPAHDSAMQYRWEGYMVTSWVDLETPALDHLYEVLRFFTRNLGNGLEVQVDYQVDDADDADDWSRCPVPVDTSPYQVLTVGDGEVTGRRARFRLRLLTDDVSVPAVVNAMDLRAVTMNEVKYDYVIDLTVESQVALIYGGDSTTTMEAAAAQLESWQEDATPLTMESVIDAFGLVVGNIDPVSLVVASWAPDETKLAGSITIRET